MSIASGFVPGCLDETQDIRGGSDAGVFVPMQPDAGTTAFVSAEPTYRGDPIPPSSYADAGSWADSAADSASEGGTAPDGGTEDPEDPERVIEEADIIRLEGDLLYALSEYRGLVVVDVSDPDHLSTLGRHSVNGRPFEMYLRDGVVFAMFGEWAKHSYSVSTGEWEVRTTSRVVALDVADPGRILEIGGADLPGDVSDSRIVGDVLYVVTHESGYCWGCGAVPRTAVTSLSIADPGVMSVVDRLGYDESWGGDWDGRRSVMVTTERMYVSGTGASGVRFPMIQVVDISDPAGQLRPGAQVEVAGTIRSRWQMDEYDGVLRVATQPGGWSDAPVVETFQVLSSDEIVPLGSLDVLLPAPEDLMSVRFDGPIGYVVTYQRPTPPRPLGCDPLFLIDLSDPAHPLQRGDLEFPGWLYHMEPRGDRLFALGLDEGTPDALTVTLFDVSDLDAPAMLDRVHFGGSSGSVLEDQDRIQKAFRILPELGMILMPFAGWFYDSGDAPGYYRSGIQITDFTRDDLVLRGVAAHRGMARRAFVHRDRLFAMSDERVETFDITDRDTPARTSSLPLARTVYRAAPAGSLVAELVGDWWTGEGRLDLMPASDPDGAEPVGSVDLSGLRPTSERLSWYWRGGFRYDDARLFTRDEFVYLAWGESRCSGWSYSDYCRSTTPGTGIAVVDVADPAAPRVLGSARFGSIFPQECGSYGWYYAPTVESGESIVQVGSTIAMRQSTYAYCSDWGDDLARGVLLFDLSDPAAPRHAATISFPGTQPSRALHAAGTLLYTSHRERVTGAPSLARFFLDRIDLSDPDRPGVLPAINVPGSPIHFDPESGRLITVDYTWVRQGPPSGGYCGYYSTQPYRYDASSGYCYRLEHSVNLLTVDGDRATLVDRVRMTSDRILSAVATPERVFLGLSGSSSGYDYRHQLLALDITSSDALRGFGRARSSSYATDVPVADGTRVVTVNYSPPAALVWDASDPGRLVLRDTVLLPDETYDVRLSDDGILSTHGPWGVRAIPVR